MGEKDNMELEYFSDSSRFADIWNFYMFGGKSVIKSEDLQDADSVIVYKTAEKKRQKRIPDKIKEKIRVAVNDSTMRSHGTIGHPKTKGTGIKYDIWKRYLSPDSKSVSYKINRSNPLLVNFIEKMDHNEARMFESILRQIESYIPKTDIHLDECRDIAVVDPWKTDDKELEDELISLVQISSNNLKDQEDLLDQFLRSQKFSPLQNISKILHERLKNEF